MIGSLKMDRRWSPTVFPMLIRRLYLVSGNWCKFEPFRLPQSFEKCQGYKGFTMEHFKGAFMGMEEAFDVRQLYCKSSQTLTVIAVSISNCKSVALE